MQYKVGSFKPYIDRDEQQFYVYIDNDFTNRVCMMVGDYNTEHAANIIAETLNKQSFEL